MFIQPKKWADFSWKSRPELDVSILSDQLHWCQWFSGARKKSGCGNWTAVWLGEISQILWIIPGSNNGSYRFHLQNIAFGELLTDVPSFFLRVFLLHYSTAENKQTLFVVTAAQKTFSRSEFPIAQINHITDFIGTTFLVQCCANVKFIFFWRELQDFAKWKKKKIISYFYCHLFIFLGCIGIVLNP